MKKNLNQFFLYILIWILIFSIFRFFNLQNQSNLKSTFESVSSNEYTVSSSYSLSKAITNLERLKLAMCTQLTQEDGIVYYETTYSYICNARFILGVQFQIRSGNGKIYSIHTMSYEVIRFFIFELLIYIFLILIVFFHRKLQIQKDINTELNFQISIAKLTALSSLASQVSHDIRSPLSALNMMMGGLDQLPEEKRTLIRNAVQRINDIANNLLEQSRNKNSSTSSIDSSNTTSSTLNKNLELSTQLLAPIIDTIISEKRIQYRDKINIHIEADLTQAYGLFIKANAIELKRVISNLINNSVEAFAESEGNITAYIRRYGDNVHVIIQDNGKGIPAHILAQLGEKGVSHGKEGTSSGSGLGVYHAKETIQSFGGEFKIESKEGMGTTIYLIFPKAESPSWFVEELHISKSSQIIALDDDQAIHNLWDGRFQSLRTHEEGIGMLHFSSLDSVDTESITNSELLLVDYEFLGSKKSGLDFILENHLEDKAILVTSRYEEKNVLERCQKHNVRLIPKNMAAFVPIQIQETKLKPDAVLLDDDSIIHMTWKMEADSKNKKVLMFARYQELILRLNEISKDTPIYVDVNLGQGDPRGEAIAEELFKLGYKNIYLATGYESDQFSHLTWLKGVVGKEPRF